MSINKVYKNICKIFHVYFYVFYKWSKEDIKGFYEPEANAITFIFVLIILNVLYIESSGDVSKMSAISITILDLLLFFYLSKHVNEERIEKYKEEYKNLNPYLKITFKIIIRLYIIFTLYGMFLVLNPRYK